MTGNAHRTQSSTENKKSSCKLPLNIFDHHRFTRMFMVENSSSGPVSLFTQLMRRSRKCTCATTEWWLLFHVAYWVSECSTHVHWRYRSWIFNVDPLCSFRALYLESMFGLYQSSFVWLIVQNNTALCLKQAALVPVSLDWLLFVNKTMFVFTVHIHPGVTESENPEQLDFSNSWKWFNGWSKVCDGCKRADALTHAVSSFHWKQTFSFSTAAKAIRGRARTQVVNP